MTKKQRSLQWILMVIGVIGFTIGAWLVRTPTALGEQAMTVGFGIITTLLLWALTSADSYAETRFGRFMLDVLFGIVIVGLFYVLIFGLVMNEFVFWALAIIVGLSLVLSFRQPWGKAQHKFSAE
ncbi:hypothetical protein [Lacticaseibacillus saniviri]|uniref:Uncharacterized protein n=1 Tax=Lacticaseibacillus saniviri JCM 17471 = DSM 24301 TaxID=1293598 RepID=A0A0R2MP93_9LACO|nr:hypothetical protein [Lacticaseibacillus saniviri]KRO15479.1 hypothetical protein IV56_GL002245 [Lacticaseibacillus saniviri JCM 17471 = DSM 24301]MCG4281315.1 hypothetical protein [Lacticaseibacillus saniviri]